jgi:hypothetical protein
MKTKIIFRFALLCLSVGIGRVHAALEWDQKEISTEARRGAQEDVRAVFEFKNTGKKTVTILGITTSCSCTVASPDSSRIPVGEKSRVWTVFTVGNRTGLQEKKITLATDDPDAPEVVLTLKVNILDALPGK